MSRTGSYVPQKLRWNFIHGGMCELCQQPMSHKGRDYWNHVGGQRGHLSLEGVYSGISLLPWRKWSVVRVLPPPSINCSAALTSVASSPKTGSDTHRTSFYSYFAQTVRKKKKSELRRTRRAKGGEGRDGRRTPDLASVLPSPGPQMFQKTLENFGSQYEVSAGALERRSELRALLLQLLNRNVISNTQLVLNGYATPERAAWVTLQEKVMTSISSNYPLIDTAQAAALRSVILEPKYSQILFDICDLEDLFRGKGFAPPPHKLGGGKGGKIDHAALGRQMNWRRVGEYDGWIFDITDTIVTGAQFAAEKHAETFNSIHVTERNSFVKGLVAQLHWASSTDGWSEGCPWPDHPLFSHQQHGRGGEEGRGGGKHRPSLLSSLTPDIMVACQKALQLIADELVYLHSMEAVNRVEKVFLKYHAPADNNSYPHRMSSSSMTTPPPPVANSSVGATGGKQQQYTNSTNPLWWFDPMTALPKPRGQRVPEVLMSAENQPPKALRSVSGGGNTEAIRATLMDPEKGVLPPPLKNSAAPSSSSSSTFFNTYRPGWSLEGTRLVSQPWDYRTTSTCTTTMTHSDMSTTARGEESNKHSSHMGDEREMYVVGSYVNLQPDTKRGTEEDPTAAEEEEEEEMDLNSTTSILRPVVADSPLRMTVISERAVFSAARKRASREEKKADATYNEDEEDAAEDLSDLIPDEEVDVSDVPWEDAPVQEENE